MNRKIEVHFMLKQPEDRANIISRIHLAEIGARILSKDIVQYGFTILGGIIPSKIISAPFEAYVSIIDTV
ncbi:hypothetical protein NH340_JMT07575 [Sarcoptes scabiei]|nr:hypothetical protein NH340_JMT07575 [Sarcoptes scabiei]